MATTYEQIKSLATEAYSSEATKTMSPSDTPQFKEATRLLQSAYGYSPELSNFLIGALSGTYASDRMRDAYRQVPGVGSLYGSTYDVDKYWGGLSSLAEQLARGVKTEKITAPASEYHRTGGYNIYVPTGGEPTYGEGQMSPSDARQYLLSKGIEPTTDQIAKLTGQPLGTTGIEPTSLAAITGEEPTRSVKDILGMFTVTDQMKSLNVLGAVRLEGGDQVWTIGPGGRPIKSPEDLLSQGFREDQVIEISREEAKMLGITDIGGGVVGTSDEAIDLEEEEKEERYKSISDDITDLTFQRDKLTLEAEIAQLKDALGLGDAPTPTSLLSTYEALRSDQGIPALEQRLNDLNAQISDVEASLRQGLYSEEGKLAPMELIGTKQRELARQGQELLDTLGREKTRIVDELNTKNSMISNIMNLTQQDYANASNAYNNAFSQNIQLLEMIKGEEAQETDFAIANLNAITSMLSTTGKTWGDLDPGLQATIGKLEIQAGLPRGLTQAIFDNIDPAKEERFHVISDDKSTVSIFYTDGSVEVFNTGITGGGGGWPTGTPNSYKEWVLAGSPGTYEEWVKEGGRFQPTSDDIGKLINAGLTENDANAVINDAKKFGIQAVIDSGQLTDDQINILREVIGGKGEAQIINDDYLKDFLDGFEASKLLKYATALDKARFIDAGTGIFKKNTVKMDEFIKGLMETIEIKRKGGMSDLQILEELQKKINTY